MPTLRTTVTKETADGEVLVDEFRTSADPTIVICRPAIVPKAKVAKPEKEDDPLENLKAKAPTTTKTK